MLAAETVIDLKAVNPNIKLHMLLPCPPEEQFKGWSNEQITRYQNILEAADSITVVSEHYTRDCMKFRNKQLIKSADCCICCCANLKTGTGQTLRYAKEKEIFIINLFVK